MSDQASPISRPVPQPRTFRSAATEILLNLAVAAAAFALFYWVLEIWRADWSVPFVYWGDGIQSTLFIKGYLEDGGLLIQRLGAPRFLDHREFPNYARLDLLIIRLIALFRSDAGFVVNTYYALSYALVAISCNLALRRLKISASAAAGASLLFTFLVFHPYSNISHLFLTNYFLVPPMALVAIRFAQGAYIPKLLVRSRKEPGEPQRRLNTRLAAALLLMLLAGQGHSYWLYLGGVLCMVAILMTSRSRRRFCRSALAGLLLLAAAGVSFFAQLWPTFDYLWENGRTPASGRRTAAESERYSLRISSLLLPSPEHRVPWMSDLRSKHDNSLISISLDPLPRLADSLGIVGGSAFLVLISSFFIKGMRLNRLGRILARLALAGLLYATAAGFGYLFSLLVTPQFRVLSRMNLFLAFFSLAAAAMGFDWLRRRCPNKTASFACASFPLAIAVLGAFDQVTYRYIPDYEKQQRQYFTDQQFVQTIEKRIPPGSLVFQLPIAFYPEQGTLGKMEDYQHGVGFIHSDRLRWSYGATQGGPVYRWQRTMVAKTLPDLIAELRRSGFRGLWVDLRGYDERADEVLAELKSQFPPTSAISSRDGNRIFFPL